jgi:hypothetical protein
MAEDKFEPREINLREWLPWTLLLRSFWVAVDYKKLLLAAAGIVCMAFGWWILAAAFYKSRTAPVWPSEKFETWDAFEKAHREWNLFYEAAGPGSEESDPADQAADLAHSPEEFDEMRAEIAAGKLPKVKKPTGKLRALPWFEDRGPNPFLLLTGHTGDPEGAGAARYVPWQRGEFFDWFLGAQVPVLIEPLIKFLRPVFYLLNPNASGVDRIYFLLVIGWTVVVWAIFGGAITRIAAVEVARNEKIGFMEAVRYTTARWQSYVFASFAPLLGLAFFVLLLILFGLVNLIPVVAEFWNGLLWWIPLGIGLVMAVLLIGLVGWPMIHATLSAEGSDSFDALSRCYSYVLQKPWNYLWNVIVALMYGAIVVFFVGLMGSMAVYLSKWGVSHVPLADRANRDPSYLFIYAPTSFGWRELLLQGSPIANNGGGANLQAAIDSYKHADDFHGWNYIGPVLVSFWLYLAFLGIIGFGYSYFWSASTIIYLLMRQKVDDTDLDEVYLEEEDSEEPYTPPAEAGAAPPPQASGLQMVESPSLRAPAPSAPRPPEGGESPATQPGDGNAPAGGGAGQSS